MRSIVLLFLLLVLVSFGYKPPFNEPKKPNQLKTCGCQDFEGYILTSPSKFNKNKWEYWFILKFDGILSEDCGIKYLTANKNTKFEFPRYPGSKTLTKGKQEYVIYDNGFYYGEYKDKHKVFSYPLSEKIDWSYHSKTKYKNLNWKETSDKKQTKRN